MKRRKGRPLLVAAAGVAFVSFACEKPDVITSPSPVGNLRGPEPLPMIDAGEPDDASSSSVVPSDAGAAPTDTGVAPVKPDAAEIITAPSPPVGNLRAPDYTPGGGGKGKPVDAGTPKKIPRPVG